MATQEKQMELETLAKKMADLLAVMEKLPTASTTADLAKAVGIVPAMEKALRKLKNAWTAEIVRSSAQQSLQLK